MTEHNIFGGGTVGHRTLARLVGAALSAALAASLLAACTGQANQSAVSLLDAASAKSTTVASLVTKGVLFCEKEQPWWDMFAPAVFAAANAYGVPVIVTDQAADVVASTCATLGAVAVSPPADPASVPVVPTVTTLPTVS